MNSEANDAAEIVIEAHNCANRHTYRVVFTGAEAEQRALSFIAERRSTHAFHELESHKIPDTAGKLLAYLYPECEHGLSLSNCFGPQHYYYDEEEQARGLFNS
jgi:hypothetical protein